jgi:hypothetical protein
MGEVRPLRRAEPTPLQFIERANKAGGRSTELGLRILLSTLPDAEVPPQVRSLWRQIAAADAGISVMLNELCAILEAADPAVSLYID